MSVGDWILTLFITAIPLIGLVMLFVWAFGSGDNPNKTNYAKGALILYAIMIGIYLVIVIMFGAAFMGMSTMST